MSHNHYDLAIIGAGMTGLMLATHLRRGGDARSILLLDKGRSVGGRLATRRVGGGRADHGAQFFTVRDDRFESYVREWLDLELVYLWARGWSQGSTDGSKADGNPRYAVRAGMNSLAKYLAAQLTADSAVAIQTGVRIKAVHARQQQWQIDDETGMVATSGALVLTAPVPQALDLLAAGDVRLDENAADALRRIEYAPCLCGLYLLDGALNLPEVGALQRPNSPITWIADNQRKGISPGAKVITIHVGPEMSRALYDESDDIIELLLRDSLESLLNADAIVLDAQVKRWRYALPLVLHPERFLRTSHDAALFFAGDAFGGPRVEGAALSGITLAEALL